MLPDRRGALRARARRRVLPGAVLVVAVASAGCGGSTHHSTRAGASKVPAASSSFVAARWWSNSAVTVGSKISSAHPDEAARKLHASMHDYCGMLKQTVAAGKSILPDITATDPALLTSTRAFVAEIEKVAPPGITAQWQVVGPAILALVESGGDTAALPSVDQSAVTTAATAIADDSLKHCGVNLSTSKGATSGG